MTVALTGHSANPLGYPSDLLGFFSPQGNVQGPDLSQMQVAERSILGANVTLNASKSKEHFLTLRTDVTLYFWFPLYKIQERRAVLLGKEVGMREHR